MLLLGRWTANQEVSIQQAATNVVRRDVGALTDNSVIADLNQDTFEFTPHFSQIRGVTGIGTIRDVTTTTFDLYNRTKFEIYSAELQQIATLGMQTFVLGGRYQSGQFDTTSSLSNIQPSYTDGLVDYAASTRHDVVRFDRVNLYLYDTLRPRKPGVSSHVGIRR